MWNMPSMGGVPAIVLLTVPLCQKPPRSVWLITEVLTFPPGPIGVGSAVPSHVQFPSKNFRFDISAAGLGGASGAAAQGTTAAKAAATSAPVIDRAVMAVSFRSLTEAN